MKVSCFIHYIYLRETKQEVHDVLYILKSMEVLLPVRKLLLELI